MIWTALAILAVAGATLYRAWFGWRDGAATEMRYLIVTVFAVLLGLHFWQPATEFLAKNVPVDPRYLALLVFVGLTALGAFVAGLAVRLKGYGFHQQRANRVDQGLGAIVGLANGALIGSTLVMVMVIALPVYFADPEKPDMAQRIGVWPMQFCREVEKVAAVLPGSPDRTRFPAIKFELREAEAGDDVPKAGAGERMMVKEAVVVWR